MSQAALPPTAPRVRRKRRLAAALRALAAQEAQAVPQPATARLVALAGRLGQPARPTEGPVAQRLRGLAEATRAVAPADADPAELLARVAATAPLPAEVCVAIAAALLPLLRLPPAPEMTAP